MTDETKTPAASPAAVNTMTIVPVAAAIGFRQMVLMASGAMIVLGFFSKRDIEGLIDWLQTEPGLVFGSAMVGAVTIVWGQVRTINLHNLITRFIREASAADDNAK